MELRGPKESRVMSSSDEHYKRSIKQSFQRQIKKMRSRDEERLIAENSKRRRKTKRRPPRRRDWDDVEDEALEFEVIRSAPQVDLSKVASPGRTCEAHDEQREGPPGFLVTQVQRDRVRVQGDAGPRVALLDAKSPQACVGDEVWVEERSDGELRLAAIAPRRSVIARRDPGDPRRELVQAANVDVAAIVASAARPAFRPGLVDRFLITLERGGVTPLLVLNKVDLVPEGPELEALQGALTPYVELGVEVIETSAESGTGLEALRTRLQGETCVFVGHSGVGKSTLLNALDPGHRRDTGSGREFDGKGRHTTTSSELVFLPGGTRLIDTPGIRTLSLTRLEAAELAACFPDLVQAASRCRFRDCTHLVEPDCGVRAAVESGELRRSRFEVYARLHAELEGAGE